MSLLDTLNLLSYTYVPPADSSICFQVHYIDQAGVSGNTDLQSLISCRTTLSTSLVATGTIGSALSAYAQLFQQFTNGTIEGFTDATYQSRIRRDELTIRYPDPFGDTTVHYFAFTRYYYYNSRFLAFTLTGPELKLTTLYAYNDIKRAAFKISLQETNGDIASCSATLVNRNTSQSDLGQYFITAWHCFKSGQTCGGDQFDFTNQEITIIFNYQSPQTHGGLPR